MISVYTINYPAVLCFVILMGGVLFHLLRSRKMEFETLVLPSSAHLTTPSSPLSLWSEKDVAINCPCSFDHLSCRTLYVGPKAVLDVKEIVADRIIVEGVLHEVLRISAREEVIVKRTIEALRIQTPRLVLEKNSKALIQVVPRTTKIVRKKGAQTQGFFPTEEEAHKVQQSMAKPVAAAKEISNPVAKVRFLRRG